MRLMFSKWGAAGLVVAVYIASSASAQVPNQIIQDMLRSMQRHVRPFDPGTDAGPVPYPYPPPQKMPRNISSSKPTINCSNVQSPLGNVLCNDEMAAKSDWDVSAAAWAYSFSLEDVARKAFWKKHDEWVQSVTATCRLTLTISDAQRRCVVNAYRGRAKALQARLTGDALAEAQLAPEQRANIQERLVSLGYLSGEPDAEFGPNTRAGIRLFQRANGFPESAYLTVQQRQVLLASGQPSQSRAQRFPDAAQSGQSTQRFPDAPQSGQSQAQRFPDAPQSGQSQAERFPDAPTGQADTSFSGHSESTQAAPTKTVKVTASGDSSDAAWKEAARMAVQQVAGVYIDHRRTLEMSMSDTKLSEIVEEKLLSYTNAYVSKFEVLSTDEKTGVYTITAEVTVRVEPLLKTLQTNNVPTVKFDSSSAAATAVTTSDEKQKAFEIYSDLIARLDNLVQIGVGKAVASPSIPSAPDSTWVSVPITFFANKDAAQEWRTKFELIAQRHAQVAIEVGRPYSMYAPCSTPTMIGVSDRRSQNFLRQNPGSGQSGVAACFVSSATPTGLSADCFGRAFIVPSSSFRGTDSFIRSVVRAARQVRLAVEFIDRHGSTVYLVDVPFQNFPSIAVEKSQSQPTGSTPLFFNYCTGNNQIIFFKVFTPPLVMDPNWPIYFGYTIIFPPPGSRINAVLNVLLPNDKISQIDSIRASLQNKP